MTCHKFGRHGQSTNTKAFLRTLKNINLKTSGASDLTQILDSVGSVHHGPQAQNYELQFSTYSRLSSQHNLRDQRWWVVKDEEQEQWVMRLPWPVIVLIMPLYRQLRRTTSTGPTSCPQRDLCLFCLLPSATTETLTAPLFPRYHSSFLFSRESM